jgi:hypothetical protein
MGRLNKSAPEGMEPFKSSGKTNAKDIVPHPKEDLSGIKDDIERIKRGLNSDAQSSWNRQQQQEAGGRSVLRSANRAGAAGLAYDVGNEVGNAIERATKDRPEGSIGKVTYETLRNTHPGISALIDKATAPSEKVELSQESKDRIARGDLENKTVSGSMPGLKSKGASDNTRAGSSPDDDIGRPKEPGGDNLRKGGKVRSYASSRADGAAKKGHTRGRYL